MAPKRMPKVTSLLAASSSTAGAAGSSSRGRNANPFGPVDPTTYHDYDEAMQDGVELEEKGERFQFGSKAQRFYVQAGTLYDRAAQLAGANAVQRADALYNSSRIRFLLASQFALPTDNLKMYVEAVNAAQEAVRLAPPLPITGTTEGTLPDPFTLDTMTHLATSLQTLAEAVEELGWPQGLAPPASISSSVDSSPTPTQLWQAALQLFQQVADGQNVILQDQKAVDEGAPELADSATEGFGNASPDDAELPAVGGDEDVYGYTSSLVTPGSLLDTLLSLVACFTSLLEASIVVEEVQTCRSAVEEIFSRAQEIASETQTALSTTSTNSDASQAFSEVTAKLEEIQRAVLTVRVTCLSKAVHLGTEAAQISSELEATIQTLNEWASRLLATPTAAGGDVRRRDTDVATLCDVGEAAYNLCRLSLRLEPEAAAVAAIWALATSSTKLFSQALAALDTSAGGGGSAAVLGQANTSTPTSRARCRILLVLSSLSIFRSHPVFEAAGIAGAKGTLNKLIDNARLYARKAVTEIGLGSLLRPAPSQVSRSAVAPPPGGWESLSLESEATLHLLRALLIRANVSVAAATDAEVVAEMQTELGHIVQHVRILRKKPIQVGATPAASSIELAEWMYVQGAKSFVDSIVDDNGRNIVQDEISWWEQLFTSQLAVA